MTDLKHLRERASLTQDDLAGLLGLEQYQVSRIESDPGSMPAAFVLPWARSLGIATDELLDVLGSAPTQWDIEPLSPKPTAMDAVIRQVEHVHARLRTESEKLEQQLPERIHQDIHQTADHLQPVNWRPRVAVYGPFDSGKSTLINALLGQDVMPTAYQPTTNAIVVLRHISHKPEWMAEPVRLLDRALHREALANPEHIENATVLRGNLALLTETSDGAERDNIIMALAYLDAPVLRTCDLVDLPGFEHNPTDSSRAVWHGGDTAKHAAVAQDALLYLSPVPTFLDASDLAHLASLTRPMISPGALDRLGIVATHAAPHVTDDELEALFNTAAERVAAQYRPHDGDNVSVEALREQFFPFFRETPNRSTALWQWLESLLEQDLPEQVGESLRDLLRDAAKTALQRLDDFESVLLENQSKTDDNAIRSTAASGDLNETKEVIDDAEERLLSEIRDARHRAQKHWEERRRHLLDTEQLLSELKETGWKRREAQRLFPQHVLHQLSSELEDILLEESDYLAKVVDEQLEEIDVSISEADSSTLNAFGFDPRGAFAGSLIGATAVGGLSAWAATLGNLGAYILVAKGAGVLSAVGISFAGGSAGAVATVSALGGPVTLGVTIVTIAALSGVALTGSGWQKRLVKQLSNWIEKHDVIEDLDRQMNEFWDQTVEAARNGMEKVRTDAREAAEEHEKWLSSDAASEDHIAAVRRARDLWQEVQTEAERTGTVDA